MNEFYVKRYLDFLCKDYNFKYNSTMFNNYLQTGGSVYVYSYYNSFGCFSISNFAVKGEIGYHVFNSLDDMIKWFPYSHNYIDVNIFNYERDIWKKNEKILWFYTPFAWKSSKKLLSVLSEVIRSQINKEGEFFGIKV